MTPRKTKRRRWHERVVHWKRGRAPKDTRDQIAIDAAEALHLAYGLGPQQARDLAVALLEGHEVDDPKRPRALRPADWVLAGYRLPLATFKGRSGHLQRKAKRMRPRPEVVLMIMRMLALLRSESVARTLPPTK
jgi:hypothetical protein